MGVVQHSAKSVEHYTPPEYIESARSVMGSIDLDPATTKEVNEHIVKATDYFTQSEGGFGRNWWGNVWLNPPGGAIRKGPIKSSAALWWSHLVDEYLAGRVKQACFMGFTVEILRTTQHPAIRRSCLDFPFCVPSSRIDFLTLAAEPPRAFLPQGQPGHANVIVYLPDRDDEIASVERFMSTFSQFGACR